MPITRLPVCCLMSAKHAHVKHCARMPLCALDVCFGRWSWMSVVWSRRYQIILGYCRSPSIDACASDCKANKNCGCAFFRPTNFMTGSGFCALSNVECSEAAIGTEVDFTRIRSAITKCGYRASSSVRESWPDDAYDPVDWFGIWDDVCEGGLLHLSRM